MKMPWLNHLVRVTAASSRASGRSRRVVAIARVSRWRWAILALVVGPLLGWFWSRSPDAVTASGYSISQSQFESALLRPVRHPETGKPVPGPGGEPRRHFEDLTVYRTDHRDAYGRHVSYVVAGRYTNGRVETYRGASGVKTREIRWREAFFPAPDPYQPLAATGQQKGTATSVRDYLDSLRDKGVRYRYAWWRQPSVATPLFTAASIIMIAGIWPAMLSLAAFGTLVPPREQAATAYLPAPAPAPASAPPPPPDLAGVQSLATTLEAELASTAPSQPATSPPLQSGQASPATLPSTPQPVSVQSPTAPPKSFGQRDDDFYPTERKAAADSPSAAEHLPEPPVEAPGRGRE